MAGQTQTNATAVKLGAGALAANAAAAKSKTTVDDQGRLPDGIENGVARIVKAGVIAISAGKTNAGKPMFNAQAVVVRPEFHNGVKVAGRRTSFMENLFDTPGKKRATEKDHYDFLYAKLRDWGVDTATMFDPAKIKTMDDLLKKLNAVGAFFVQRKVAISFRTWKGSPTPEYPNPQVNEAWGGLAQVVDAAAAPEANVKDDSPAADDVPADDSGDVPPDDANTGDDTGDVGAELSDEDVDALVAVADGDEEGPDKDDAGVKLEDWCKARNADLEDEATRQRATNWAELVEWARSGVPADEPAVAVGTVIKYKTPSAPGKPSKSVQCEVKKLYKVKGVEVADLLNLVDKKTKYAAVPVGKLEAA
jgi:hypothetical protein